MSLWRRMFGQPDGGGAESPAPAPDSPTPEAPPARQPRRWIDEDTLRMNLGNDNELLTELTRLFEMERETRMQALQEALAAQDGRQIKFAAHAIKSGLTNFAAMDAVQLAGSIEHAGRAVMDGDSASLNGLDAQAQELDLCMKEMMVQLREMTGLKD